LYVSSDVKPKKTKLEQPKLVLDTQTVKQLTDTDLKPVAGCGLVAYPKTGTCNKCE